MLRKTCLLARLDSIASGLDRSGKGLALIGLGSVGLELDRLDDYSALDFFAVVEPGSKAQFLVSLDWMSLDAPIAYAFRNTEDGYKVLYQDGIFAEFAVFERQELENIPFAPGRLIWARAGSEIDDQIAIPRVALPEKHEQSIEWLLGEVLTNLFIGVGRFMRGEKLAAMRFVQEYAVDRLIDLLPNLEVEQAGFPDPYVSARRLEVRFPEFARLLPEFTQGYERTPESAMAILNFLSGHFEINLKMKEEILKLCSERTRA